MSSEFNIKGVSMEQGRSQTVAGELHGGGDEKQDRQNVQRNTEERGGGRRAAGRMGSGVDGLGSFSFLPS